MPHHASPLFLFKLNIENLSCKQFLKLFEIRLERPLEFLKAGIDILVLIDKLQFEKVFYFRSSLKNGKSSNLHFYSQFSSTVLPRELFAVAR